MFGTITSEDIAAKGGAAIANSSAYRLFLFEFQSRAKWTVGYDEERGGATTCGWPGSFARGWRKSGYLEVDRRVNCHYTQVAGTRKVIRGQ